GVRGTIDAVLHTNSDRQLEYDFIVHPGADASQVRMSFDGALGSPIDADGNLVIQTAAGPFIQPLPTSYQVNDDGTRTAVPSSYALDANGQLTFSVGAYDASSDLVIDPTPPPPTSKIWAVAVDAAGNSVAVGHYGTNVAPSYMNVQVIKYDVNGNVLFNTTYGGNGNDYGYGVT